MLYMQACISQRCPIARPHGSPQPKVFRGLFIALLTGKEAAKYFRLRGTEGTRAYNETLNKALKGRVKGVRWIDESLQQPKRLALIVSLANWFPSVAQWIARQGSLV